MRLSTVVTSADVGEAIRLMNVATQKAATDPRTGINIYVCSNFDYNYILTHKTPVVYMILLLLLI